MNVVFLLCSYKQKSLLFSRYQIKDFVSLLLCCCVKERTGNSANIRFFCGISNSVIDNCMVIFVLQNDFLKN